MKKIFFWFRRDLRLDDNIGLLKALDNGEPVIPLFIFDEKITDELSNDDPRISFIYKSLQIIDDELKKHGSGLLIIKGDPLEVWKELLSTEKISKVFSNKDYEPYAINRDNDIKSLLKEASVEFHQFKDQVIFEEGEIVKDNQQPYHVFTPYKNKWLRNFIPVDDFRSTDYQNFFKHKTSFPSLEDLGFKPSNIKVRDYDLSGMELYEQNRNYPSRSGCTYLGPHLRFGTVSIRKIVEKVRLKSDVLFSELIWREFFMQILYHYPQAVHENFKSKYDGIKWRNDKSDFEKWCNGQTGYPMVDAGMRELNETGCMHNRVRMVTAGFLCKHLMIDWRWGEAYFASKLLDFELSSNNGNWQWAAGTGCDAAPYFRIFNPASQLKNFDKDLIYVKKWIAEFDTADYPEPMVEHKFARERALSSYKIGLG